MADVSISTILLYCVLDDIRLVPGMPEEDVEAMSWAGSRTHARYFIRLPGIDNITPRLSWASRLTSSSWHSPTSLLSFEL
jgi:hypothetical protein